jgi:hypothetical protein
VRSTRARAFAVRHTGSPPEGLPFRAGLAGDAPTPRPKPHRLLWYLVALGVLSIGSVHLYLWFLYFHHVHVIGALFILDFALSLPIAASVIVLMNPYSALLAAGYALATVAAFLWSSLFGLFGYHERLVGPWQITAAAIEITTALLAVLVLALLRHGTPAPPDSKPANSSS